MTDFETHPVGTGKRIEQLAATNEQLVATCEELSNCVAVLEAKLAKALECIPPLIVIALDNLDYVNAETRDECERDIAKARITLAELKGQNDE